MSTRKKDLKAAIGSLEEQLCALHTARWEALSIVDDTSIHRDKILGDMIADLVKRIEKLEQAVLNHQPSRKEEPC